MYVGILASLKTGAGFGLQRQLSYPLGSHILLPILETEIALRGRTLWLSSKHASTPYLQNVKQRWSAEGRETKISAVDLV